ncbi:hypothetical protein J4402_00020 [Candidatus Pacearchaeota archaeon]|nr:hypothetical protein [Candidatus Pacearchaeota archaeon]
MNNFSIISLIIFVFAWVLYWEYIYPHIKFKDKTYAQSEKLLKLDLERLDTSSYSAQFIGFSFFVGGLTILDKGTIAIVLILAGLLILIINAAHEGRAERRYVSLRRLILEKNKKEKKVPKQKGDFLYRGFVRRKKK